MSMHTIFPHLKQQHLWDFADFQSDIHWWQAIFKERGLFGSYHFNRSKFERMLNNIRIEKIISTPIWAPIFLKVSALLDVTHCPKLQFCTISIKTNNATLRKWQNPYYHPMQFKGKLMNQTWENEKNPSFMPDFGHFGLHLGPKNFFCGFFLYCMLDIVASYHCMQYQGKLKN